MLPENPRNCCGAYKYRKSEDFVRSIRTATCFWRLKMSPESPRASTFGAVLRLGNTRSTTPQAITTRPPLCHDREHTLCPGRAHCRTCFRCTGNDQVCMNDNPPLKPNSWLLVAHSRSKKSSSHAILDALLWWRHLCAGSHCSTAEYMLTAPYVLSSYLPFDTLVRGDSAGTPQAYLILHARRIISGVVSYHACIYSGHRWLHTSA